MKLNSTMIKTISLGTLLAVAAFSQAAPSGNHAMSGKSYHSMQAAISAAKQSKLTAANGSDPASFAIVTNYSGESITIEQQDPYGHITETLDAAPKTGPYAGFPTAETMSDSNSVNKAFYNLTDQSGSLLLSGDIFRGSCIYVNSDGKKVLTRQNCF
jgi:hypothetical protein